MDSPRFDQFWSEKGLKQGGTTVFRGELMYLKDNTNFNLKLILSGKVYLFGWEFTNPIPHSAYLYEVMERIKRLSGGEYWLAKIHVDKASKLKNWVPIGPSDIIKLVINNELLWLLFLSIPAF